MEMFKTIEEINSSGIACEMRTQGIERLKFIGRYFPVEPLPNACEADSTIRIYQFANGYKVADTNGDPVWESADQQAWDDLTAGYAA